MRNKFADVFYEVAILDPSICMIVADISPAGSLAKFSENYPDRFINVGVAEQIMVGMSAGMAQRGMRPFIYTIATFSFYRPFEFVRDDLCYQNLPVTIVGIGGGVSYSMLGTTHHAQEDVAIAMSLPNMTIIVPCDPAETEAATRWCATQERGPVYLRLGKAGEPDLTSDASEPWRFGVVRRLRDGDDLCILVYGVITKTALEVAAQLEAKGMSVAVVTVPTLKPLDVDGISSILSRYRRVVVIEECVRRALTVEVLAMAYQVGAKAKIQAFHLQDQFIHTYGTHDDILRSHGLSAPDIARQISVG